MRRVSSSRASISFVVAVSSRVMLSTVLFEESSDRISPRRGPEYFPTHSSIPDQLPKTLRTRTELAQDNGAPDQNSWRFLLSGDERPLLPLQSKFRAEEFRPAASVVEAPLAMQLPIGQSCALARCTGRRVR